MAKNNATDWNVIQRDQDGNARVLAGYTHLGGAVRGLARVVLHDEAHRQCVGRGGSIEPFTGPMYIVQAGLAGLPNLRTPGRAACEWPSYEARVNAQIQDLADSVEWRSAIRTIVRFERTVDVEINEPEDAE